MPLPTIMPHGGLSLVTDMTNSASHRLKSLNCSANGDPARLEALHPAPTAVSALFPAAITTEHTSSAHRHATLRPVNCGGGHSLEV